MVEDCAGWLAGWNGTMDRRPSEMRWDRGEAYIHTRVPDTLV